MRTIMLAILVALVPSLALAQDPPPNYLYVRSGSGSETILTFNHMVKGETVLWLGLLNDTNLEPTYREWSAGVGLAKPSNQLFTLITRASDSWYLQIVDVPVVNVGKLNLTAFVSGYIPLQSIGVKQILVDPATALWKINNRLGMGGSWTYFQGTGINAQHGLGPTVQFTVTKGTVNIDLFKGVRNYPNEFRATLQLAF